MPLTHLVEPTRGEFSGCESEQRPTVAERPSRPSPDRQSAKYRASSFRLNGEPPHRLSYAASFRAEDVKPGRNGRLVWKGPQHEAKPSDFSDRKAKRFPMEDCVGQQR